MTPSIASDWLFCSSFLAFIAQVVFFAFLYFIAQVISFSVLSFAAAGCLVSFLAFIAQLSSFLFFPFVLSLSSFLVFLSLLQVVFISFMAQPIFFSCLSVIAQVNLTGAAGSSKASQALLKMYSVSQQELFLRGESRGGGGEGGGLWSVWGKRVGRGPRETRVGRGARETLNLAPPL